ncbi:putative F-box domain containing protein [Tanacetum coccineum]
MFDSLYALDVVEDILSRSDAEDLIRWKRVCKSWYSLISSPSFVKLHLKINGNNRQHLRIMMPWHWKAVDKISNKSLYEFNSWRVVGSSNGLVCFSRIHKDGLTVINNPWTREVIKLPMSPLVPAKVFGLLTMSFGYDSYTDDYKVVMSIQKGLHESLVQVLSLKSNTWKLIGQFNYLFCYNKPGILCNGALHWFVFDYHDNEISNQVILSFDLSREEFTVFPEPNDSRYDESSFTLLGMLEDQLCIFSYDILNENDLPREIWVMRSYNVQDSWELLSNDCEIKYEVVHYMNMLDCNSPKKITTSFFCNYNNKCLSKAWKYINAHKFVPSLVSPVYVITGRPSHPKNNISIEIWSAQAAEGECPHLPTKIRNFIKTPEQGEIEEAYRLEVGETENLYLHEEDETKIEIEERGSHTIPLCAERG